MTDRTLLARRAREDIAPGKSAPSPTTGLAAVRDRFPAADTGGHIVIIIIIVNNNLRDVFIDCELVQSTDTSWQRFGRLFSPHFYHHRLERRPTCVPTARARTATLGASFSKKCAES